MALIAPDTFRVSMTGDYDGQPVAHVLDFIPVLVSGALPARADLGDLICERLSIAWQANLSASQSELVTYTGCTWLDLDSELGPTGVYSGGEFPVVGLNTNQPFPGNVAARVIKNASGPRGSRTGSFYLPGVTENLTTALAPNNIGGVAGSDLETRVADFFTDLEEPGTFGGAGTWGPGMVVTRTRDTGAGPEWVATSRVEGLSLQNRLGSQRRRLSL